MNVLVVDGSGRYMQIRDRWRWRRGYLCRLLRVMGGSSEGREDKFGYFCRHKRFK